jgi:hypothetical protein
MTLSTMLVDGGRKELHHDACYAGRRLPARMHVPQNADPVLALTLVALAISDAQPRSDPAFYSLTLYYDNRDTQRHELIVECHHGDPVTVMLLPKQQGEASVRGVAPCTLRLGKQAISVWSYYRLVVERGVMR